MSNKFTTMVTNEGIDLLQASSQQDKKIEFLKIIGSSTAYSENQLVSVTYDDVANRASKNQEGTINNVLPEKTVTKMELLLDGHDVKSDYTLNSIFIIAKLKDSDNLRVFAVLKANQPQYMNAYNGSGSTNLQVNVGIKFDNADNISIEVNNAAIATLADLERLGQDTGKKISDEVSRATANENKISGQLDSEINRAKSAEADLNSKIDSEVKRSTNTDSATNAAINGIYQSVSSQRTQLENAISSTASQLSSNLQNEVTRATNAESELKKSVDNNATEIASRAEVFANSILQLGRDYSTKIASETTRATTAESSLDEKIKNEQNRALLKENSLQTQMNSEVSRAKQVESSLSSQLSGEISRAKGSENSISSLANSNKNRLDANDKKVIIQSASDGVHDIMAVEDGYSQKAIMKFLRQNINGAALGISANGLTVVGGGESAQAILNNVANSIAIDGKLIDAQTKELYLTSDGPVKIITNTQDGNPGVYKSFRFYTNGDLLVPGNIYSNDDNSSVKQQITTVNEKISDYINLEERREIPVNTLTNNWKLAHEGDRPLRLIVTQGGALLTGDVQPKTTGTSSYGAAHYIAKVPSEITFRGATYAVDFKRYFLAPIGDRITSNTNNSVRIYLNYEGALIVDETQDYIKGAPITLNCYLDIKKKNPGGKSN